MKKRVLSLFLALTLCLTLTPTGALAAEGQPPEQTVSVTQETETGAGENASPAKPEENPTENAPAAAEKNSADEEPGKEAAAATGREESKADGSPSDDDAAKVQNQLVMAAAAGPDEPTMMGQNDLPALADEGQTPANAQKSEGGGIYVPPGSPTEGGGGTYIPGEDTRTEIWCVSKPDSIGRSYDGTTDGSTIPIDLTFTDDGTNEIKLKEGTGFTATKTFDSADAGWHTVTVEITLIGEAAAKYKLKADEEKFEINGFINKAYPDLTVSLSKTTCAVGEKILPLLSVEGAPEDAAVTYYYTQYKSIAGDSDYEGNAIPAIDESTAISSLDEEGNNTYYVYAKTAATQNYEEERSATVELTVNEAVVEAASVTKADGTVRGTYKTLPAALNAAQDGDTVKLLADHTTDWDAVDASEEQPAVVKSTITLDLNGKTVDYLVVGEVVSDEEGGILDSYDGNLTVVDNIQGGSHGKIKDLEFVQGSLAIQGGQIGDSDEGGLTCNVNSGNATISGGTVLGLEVSEGATVTVNGGTVLGLKASEGAAVTVNDGSAHAGTWLNEGTLNITGGTFGDVLFRNNGGTIAISGGTFGAITNHDASSSIPLMPLLANGYAFYKDNVVQDSTAKTMTDVTVGAHTHVPDENGKCACGASIIASVKTADGAEQTYGSFADALAAAVKSNGSTLQLLYDVDLGDTRDGLSVDSGSFTLDLNGKTLSGEVYNQLLAVSGTANITIKNGKLINTFYKDQSDINSSLANAVQINGGAMALEDIEVTSGRGEDGAYTDAVELYGGSLTVTSGTFTGAITVMSESSDVHPTLKIKTATLHNGIAYFTTNTSQPDYDVVKAFFADGSLLFDKDGKYIDITKAEYWESGSTEEYSISVFQYGEESIVKPHTHTIVNGKCSVCGELAGDGCIAHAVWSPWADDPKWRTTHIKTMDELREKITNPGTEWLDYDNNATVTFLCDVTVDKTFLIDNYFTNIIIDLNGHTLSGALDDPIITANFVSGTGTIVFKNGKIVNTGSGEAIRLAKGKVTLENVDVTGDLSLTPDFVNSRSYIPTFLGGGSFTKICTVNDAGGWQKVLEDMLPKGYYFADITSGKRVSQTVLKADSPLENVTVKPCNHKDADGKSTFTYKPERQTYYYCSICGNICPHEHRTELADGKLHCEDCGLTLTAARRDSKNTITYYIDMSDAFGNAYQPIIWPLCDQTCTQAAMTYYGSNTIDLNGFTVTASNSSGVLFAPYVSDSKMTLQNSAENQGHYVCEYLRVNSGGTLAIPAENNNLTISAVLIESDGNANLAGGSFGKISVKGEKTLAGLLVPGYYFADTASGEPAAMYDADGNALTELTNVTVQPCSHNTAVCGSDGVWKCLCGQNVFVASVTKDGTPTYYTDLQNAFSAADGNTVKLMANVRDVTVSTDKPFTFDLNGYNVYSLTVNNKSTIKDSATVKGKITEWLEVPSGMTVGELLEDGYTFKKSSGMWCSEAEQAGQAVGDVSIWPVPIRSVTAANPSVTVAYGQTSGVTLTATVVPFAEGGTYTCQWYKIGGTVSPLDGATDSTYQLPVDLAAGTYTYRLTATEDGYEKSCDFTVTVTPVSIEGAAVNVQSLTYNGVAQNPTATVSLGETVLTENRDYTVTATPQTDVGSYMLTVTGKGNYTGKIKNVNWKIEPMQLYRFCNIEPVTKTYDGTATAPIAKSALTFHDANARGASVTLPEDAYDITNARFTMRQGDGTYADSPEAGNGKSLSFTVTLKSGNYVFKGDTADVMDCDYTTDSASMFTIMQDTISLSGIQFTQYVFNDLAKTYEIELKPLLDDILSQQQQHAGREYGDIKYGKPSVFMDSDYYPAGGATIGNGKLSLSINKAASFKQGDEIGTVAVQVETTNYQPFTLTIHVSAQDKLVPVLAEGNTVSAMDITYGQKLADSTLTATGSMICPRTKKVIPGTFAWTNPEAKPGAAGDYTASWTFTPAEGYEEYAPATGNVTVKVNKADPTFTAPTAQENLTYTGQEQALITAGMTDYGTMQYSLTENGTYSQDIPTGTDAGTYTVWYRVIGDENHNDTAPASVAVRIGQKPLTITGVTAESKPYDGTTNAGITSVTFNNVTLNRGTDYTVTASFDDAGVGNYKNITATVTLIDQAAKNYFLEQSSFHTTGSITKAAIASDTQLHQTVFNDLEKTYEIDLNQVLDKILPEGGNYGDIQYGQPRVFMDSDYYPVGGATIGNGKLSLSINKAASSKQGDEIGTVVVEVETTNYQTFTLTIHVSVQDKLVPVLAEGNTVSATDITYGQKLADSKLTVNGTMQDSNTGAEVKGTFAWTNKDFKPDASDSYEAEWTFTPAEGYEEYATATGTVTIKVNKATPTFTAPTAQENLTYTGQEQALITAGMTDYGTMQYSLTENGTYSQDIPTGTDAGAYTVWYRVIGDANHNDTAPASVAVSIGKKPLTITGVTAATKLYDGTTNADISSVTFDNVTLNRGTDYNVTASFDDASVGNGKNITATVTLMEQAAKNYALEQSSFPATGSITKAAAPTNIQSGTLTITNGLHKTYSFDLSTLLPKLTAPCDYGTITYDKKVDTNLGVGSFITLVNGKTGELTLEANRSGTDEGQFGTITVTISTSNYQDITLTVKVKAVNQITPVPEDGKITASKITYGQALSDSTITGTMQDPATGATVNGTFTWDTPDVNPNAGSHDAKWTFTPDESYGGKYTTNTGTATVTVDPKAVTVSGITAKDKVYDGKTNATLDCSNAKFDGVLENDTLTVTVTGTFESANAGKQKVKISGFKLGGNSVANYVPSTENNQTETTATITAKEVTVAITPNGGTYGSVTAAAAVLSGVVDGETVPVTLTYTGNGYNSTSIPTDVDSYTVTASIADNNYILTGETTANFVITPKTVIVSGITSKDKAYDGKTNATLDCSNAKFDGVLENDTLTVTVTGTFESANAGKQKVKISGFKLGGNSVANYVPSTENNQTETTATITAKEVTVAITPNGGTYGSVTAAAAVLSGVVDGETVPVTLTYTGNGYNSTSIPTDVDSYTVTASIADNNYILTGETTANFVITPKTVIVSGITAKDKAYDGTTNATLDFSNAKFVGILENDKLTVTAKGVFEKTEAGKWNVAISDLTLGGNSVANYVLAESGNQTETTATITAKQITVSITPNGGIYGETITPATVKANDVVGEDAPTITLTYTGTANDGTEYTDTTPPAKAGTYTVTATTTNPNYTLDPDTNTAEFAIAKRPATVTPDNKSKVYKEKDPDPTYAVSGVLDGETLKGITLTRAEGENAGEYAITATADAGANPNYDVTFAKGKFTINPKSIDGAKVVLGKALTANGAEQTQTVEKVLLDGKELPAGSYTVTGNTATAPGSHTLTITAKGNYTGTVKQTYVIVPAKAADAPGEEITIGSGKVNVDVQSEGAVPPAALLTDKAELLAMLVDSGDITAEELAQIADGASVDIVLTVKEANVSDEVKAAMAQAAKGYTIGQYLDISLFKYMTVNGSQQAGVPLHTTRDALTISVVVPDALINTNSAVNRTYCIVRRHDGAITVLDAAFDAASKTLTFKTDRFSIYAIAYKDTAVPSSGSNPSSNNSSNDSEAKKNEVAAPTPAPTPASTSKPSTITAMPQTGDTSNPTLYVVLLVASLLGLAVVFVCKKRNDK